MAEISDGLMMRTITALEALRGCLVDPCETCIESVRDHGLDGLCIACQSVHDRASEALQDLRLLQLSQPRPDR
jgi:hypothetical protein